MNSIFKKGLLLIAVPLLFQGDPQFVMGLGVFRSEAERLVQVGDGPVRIPQVHQGVSQVELGGGALRVGPDRFLQLGDGPVPVPPIP